jgi:hypothetical protein
MKSISHLLNLKLTQPDPEFAQKLRRTVPGMAHFAGTGPVGEACGQCSYLAETTRRGKRFARCGKYTELMDGKPGDAVPKSTPACRYFSPRQGLAAEVTAYPKSQAGGCGFDDSIPFRPW